MHLTWPAATDAANQIAHRQLEVCGPRQRRACPPESTGAAVGGYSGSALSNFQAVYYRDTNGEEPVRQFVDALDEEAQAAIENQIDRLNLLSDEVPHLPFPHSSQVEGELRELRCHYGRRLYRILYRRSDRLLVLLSVFEKRSAKVPTARCAWRKRAGRTSRRAWTRRAARHRAPPDTTLRNARVSDHISKNANMVNMAKQRSPIGSSVREHIEQKSARSRRYREARDRLEPFEQLARIVIMRRAQLGISQQELANRMATTASVISRIESGQHRTSAETLRRLAQALEGTAVVGFDFGTRANPERELVTL